MSLFSIMLKGGSTNNATLCTHNAILCTHVQEYLKIRYSKKKIASV